MGPVCAIEFGEGLQLNTKLKTLNLAYNNLTHKGEDEQGILKFSEVLTVNKTLENLNISGNHINKFCGKLFNERL